MAATTKESGFSLAEFSLHDGFAADTAEAARLLADAGLGVACSRGLALDADVSSEDPAVVERGVELLMESIRISHELGAVVLTGALYGAFGKASVPLSSAGRANIVASLKEASQAAARVGMTLGLEVCNRYETNVVNTATEALVMVDDIGAYNVMVHLDVYHMNIEEERFVRPVKLVGDRLGYVHVG